MNKCGIYKIVNIKTSKFYIGSSDNIDKRWKRHISELKKRKHHSVYLQRSFNKHGKTNFMLQIIELCNKKELLNIEQKYLDDLKPWNNSVGYNVSKHASGGDLLSYHPDKKDIRQRINETHTKTINDMTKKEKQLKWGKFKNDNSNWKNGKTYFTCPKCKRKIRTNKTLKTCIKCRDYNGNKNPFYGKAHSEKTKQELRSKMSGKKPTNSLRVFIDGKIFLSCSDASKYVGCSVATITNRIRNEKFPTYKFA